METFFYELALLVLILVSGFLFFFRKSFKTSLKFRIVAYAILGIWAALLLFLAYDLLQQAACSVYRTIEYELPRAVFYWF